MPAVPPKAIVSIRRPPYGDQRSPTPEEPPGRKPYPTTPSSSRTRWSPRGSGPRRGPRAPVAHVRMPSGDMVGLLTGDEKVRGLLTDPRFSRNPDRKDAARMSTTEDGGGRSAGPPGGREHRGGPGHRRWRRLLSRAFTVKKREAWRPRIQETRMSWRTPWWPRGHPRISARRWHSPFPCGSSARCWARRARTRTRSRAGRRRR